MPLQKKNKNAMSPVQTNALNPELWQSINAIADNESLMRRLTRYAKRLVKEKDDSTLMTKEEFFARIDEAKKGPTYELMDGETIEDLIKRVG